MDRLARWTRLDQPGREEARLQRTYLGWNLSGRVVVEEEGRDYALSYEVACDERWRTLFALVECRVGAETFGTTVQSQDGSWRLNGAEAYRDERVLDVDLAFTPATNTLPIRRLNLVAGESAEVHAAWLTFPEFELQSLDQVYARESDRTYRYSSNGGTFQRTLTVDEEGLIVEYPGLWRRES